jgi:hypothetical protein
VITLEDRLRSYFRDEVAELDAADTLPGVLTAGRRGRRRARALLAGAIATAAAVALVVGSAQLSTRSHPRPALQASASRPIRVLTRTDLEGWGPPSGIAAVPGGVWLASWNEGGLLRIDAATGRITARVPVGQPMEGPYSIAYGAGSLWVTDFRTGDLLRLNPANGRLIAKAHVDGLYVTVGGGYVWVTTFGHVNGRYWNRLVKIDPGTDRVLGDVLVPGNYGPGGMKVAYTPQAVWLHIDGSPFAQAVDPAKMHLIAHVSTGAAWRLAAVGSRVWVLTNTWRLVWIDRPTSKVSGSVQLAEPSSGLAPNLLTDIATGPGGTLWVGGQALYLVSEASLRVRTISGFGAVDDVSVLGSTLWVQADDGYVYQVALHPPGTSAAVPDVVMMPVAAAKRLLTRGGYAVKVVREPGLEPLGVIIYENPAAGSRALPGARITLVVSAGPVGGTSSP